MTKMSYHSILPRPLVVDGRPAIAP